MGQSSEEEDSLLEFETATSLSLDKVWSSWFKPRWEVAGHLQSNAKVLLSKLANAALTSWDELAAGPGPVGESSRVRW